MILKTNISSLIINDSSIEVVERKSKGNPSAMCDLLIKHLTDRLSQIYRENYQINIDFDLTDSILLAGETIPDFQGSGSIFKPMVFILGGWATDEYQEKRLNFDYLIRNEIYTFLKENYRFLHENNFFIKNAVKMIPAKPMLKLNKNIIASDDWIAMGIGGKTNLEQIVLSVEKYLDSLIKNNHPEIGEDIVIKGILENSDLLIKIDLALVDYYIKSKIDYKNKIDDLKILLEKYIKRQYPSQKTNIIINAQLTITGTTVENMNFGRVGDGNLNNGLISYTYPQAMKTSYGKYPLHISRVYQKIAQIIANEINDKLNKRTFVWLYAEKNQPISKPRLIHVQIADYQIKDNQVVNKVIAKNLD